MIKSYNVNTPLFQDCDDFIYLIYILVYSKKHVKCQ